MLQNGIRYLLRYELHLLTLLTLAAMASESLLLVAVGVGVVLWGVHRLVAKSSLATPVDLTVLGLCLLLPITWLVSIDRATTVTQILRLLNGVLLFYAVIRWFVVDVSITKVYTLILVLESMALLLLALGFVSTKWPIGKSSSFDLFYQYLIRFSTQSTHPNVLAGTLMLFLPLPLVALFAPRPVVPRQHSLPYLLALYHRQWRFLQGAVALLLLGGIILAQSRGALLGLIAAGLTLALIMGGRRLRPLWISGLIIGGVLGFLFPSRFATLFSQFANDSALSSGAVRYEVWSRAYYIIQDFPFTGIGLGNFQQVVEQMYPLFLTTDVIPHAHNIFLQVADDLGLIGLVCWLAIVMGVTASLSATLMRTKAHLDDSLVLSQYILATALMGSQAAFLAHGLVDAVTWVGARTAPFVWLLWGVAVALELSPKQATVPPASNASPLPATQQDASSTFLGTTQHAKARLL